MATDPVPLAQALIRCRSVTPADDGALDVVQRALEPLGFACTRLVYGPDDYRVDNLFARRGSGGPHLCYAGHTDVVPPGDPALWSGDPFSGAVKDGFLHGRGACDMKGGLAALTMAFLHLHALRDMLPGRVTYTAVSDEETFGPWGARWMFEHQRAWMMGDCLLSGEPSSPHCVRFGEKSPYWIAITVRTRGGHGAYTHASASATKIAARISKALERVADIPVRAPDNLVRMFQDPDIARQIDAGCGAGHAAVIPQVTLNIGRMSGGLKMNMVPSECRIEADIRLPIGLTKEELRPHVAAILKDFPEAEWEEISPPEDAPNWSDPDGEMMRILRRTVQELGRPAPVPVVTLGGTDTRLWRYHGVPAYVYGPSPESMGAADENIPVADFHHILTTHALAAARFLTAKG